MYNPFSLTGRTILITGASSGIGKAAAIECSRLGAKVCITGRNEKRLSETWMQLEGEGHMRHVADLTDMSQLEKLVDTLPPIDGVVHSAGIIPDHYTPASFIEEEDIMSIMRSNLIQITNLNSLLLQNRILKKGGSIVHISSFGVRYPIIGYSLYSMSKGALLLYSKTLATELIAKSIRVNAILPAMIDTDIIKNSFDSLHIDNDREKYPLGYGQPEDVAWMCIYLLSDAARWITGTEFDLNGGCTLQWK